MQMPQCSINQQVHTLGDVIFLEKLPSIDAVVEEGVKA